MKNFLKNLVKSAGEIFLSGLRGAKIFSNAFRIVFRILFRVFQTVFRIDLKVFRGQFRSARVSNFGTSVEVHSVLRFKDWFKD